MSIEFIDEYDGVLPNTPRSYGRVCCICGSNETYSYNGTPVWTKYKDENREWTGEWACHNCQRRRKGRKLLKKIKRCRLCGSDKTRIRSDGKALWEKDLDVHKDWTGEYLCYKCKYENNKPSCGHTKSFYKVYKNGIWTGKYRCKACDISSQSI